MCLHQGPSEACTAKTVERDLTEAAKQALVDKHNELRRKVARGEETNGAQPAASNMKKLVWNEELAVIAQRWADQCQFDHDTGKLPHHHHHHHHHHANYDLHSPPED